MEQNHESVLAGNVVHGVHHLLVLIVGKVGLAVYGSQLELVGSNLVMTCLERNTQLVTGNLNIAHESGNT